jgi:hypothetical protein
MLKTVIKDGKGSGRETLVLEDNELLVSHSPSPPILPQKHKIFAQYLTDDGLSTGSNDLGVDGSTTAVEYWIPASETEDRYITHLSFLMGYGASGYLWQFCDGAALTNGVQVKYTDGNNVETEIANIKTNAGLLRASIMEGHIPTAWELRHLGATNDYGILASIHVGGIVIPNGIQLQKGSQQKLSIIIRDNVGAVADDFNCHAMGFERFE